MTTSTDEVRELAVVLCTTDLYDTLGRAYGIGRTAPEEHRWKIEDLIDKEAAERFDTECVRDWVRICGYTNGSAENQARCQIVRGMLYAGICQNVLDHRHGLPRDQLCFGYWAGTRAQHLLTEGLRRASPETRLRFQEEVDRLSPHFLFAPTHFAGALAVTRVIHAVEGLDLTLGVRNSTLYEDVAMKTDLVITSKRTGRGGCIVQVKSGAQGSPPVAYVTTAFRPHGLSDLPEDMRGKHVLEEASTLWEQAYRRGMTEKNLWRGLLVYVDPRAVPASELLDPALRDLLRERLVSTALFDERNNLPHEPPLTLP